MRTVAMGMWWLVAGAVAAILAMLFLPARVRVAVRLLASGTCVEVTVSPWPRIFTLRVFRRQLNPEGSPRTSTSSAPQSAKSAISSIAEYARLLTAVLSPRHRLIEVAWDSAVGMNDASSTALTCATLWAFQSALAAWAVARWGRPIRPASVSVWPVYGQLQFQSRLDLVWDIVPAVLLSSYAFRSSLARLFSMSPAPNER